MKTPLNFVAGFRRRGIFSRGAGGSKIGHGVAVKFTGRRVALSSACLGIVVIVAAAIASKDWILKKIASLRPEEPWVKRIRTLLDQGRLTASFSGRPLNRVVSSFQEMLNIKVVIDPAVDASKRLVTLSAKDMKASEFLQAVVDQTGLGYDFRDNGIYILEKPEGR
jgi:hypothetical protein